MWGSTCSGKLAYAEVKKLSGHEAEAPESLGFRVAGEAETHTKKKKTSNKARGQVRPRCVKPEYTDHTTHAQILSAQALYPDLLIGDFAC